MIEYRNKTYTTEIEFKYTNMQQQWIEIEYKYKAIQ